MSSDETVRELEASNFDATRSVKLAPSFESSHHIEPSSLDELNYFYQQMGWEGSYTQMDSGPFSASYSERIDQSLVTTSDSISIPVSIVLSTLPDCYLLCQLHSDSPGTINGYSVDSNSLILIHPDQEFSLCTTGAAINFVTFIPRAEVEIQLGDACESIVKSNQSGHIFHDHSIAATSQFKGWFQNWLSSPGLPGTSKTGLLSKQIEEIRFNAMGQIAEQLENNSRPRGRIDRGCSNRRIADLIDYFHHHPQSSLTTAEMTAMTCLSRRSLFYKFTQYTGYTPHRFFRYVRLEAFRRALLRDQGSITELGLDYGFHNLGELAGLYQATFGELPIQTKKRMVSTANTACIPAAEFLKSEPTSAQG